MIAVISTSGDDGLRWLCHNFRIQSVDRRNRSCIGTDGKKYIVISDEEQLLSLEISDYLIPMHGYANANWKQIEQTAKTRMR